METIQTVARHLRALRDRLDPISRARRERIPDRARVLAALDRLRILLLDQTQDDVLDSELEVILGMLAAVVF